MPTSMKSDRRYIRDLQPAEYISGVFCISNAQLGRTKNDKPFLKCLVKDRTGEMPGRMWSIEPSAFSRLPTEGFVYLEGETQAYQGDLQLIVRTIEPHEPTADEMQELLPVSDRDPGAMFDEVKQLLGTLKHPAMVALAKAYLDDAPLMDAFCRCPAAKSMHHAFLGGLLEHTLTLMKMADLLCPLYPKINRDIVMLGLFLHDLGKTRELIYDRAFNYTDRGELIGHIVDGAIMLHDRAQSVMRSSGLRFPRHAVLVLQHIILSHHGQPEFGAAKVPSTPEAILVSLLDNLDARTTMALAAARPSRGATFELGGNFTEKHWGLEAKLFRPDPLAEENEGR
ncbi:MAG: 3'-5' exoribonuclease YhaM family protein [Phycisphaerales bacterium]|nr:HD domain-containing protein [Phycisphaeraceae bacterium]